MSSDSLDIHTPNIDALRNILPTSNRRIIREVRTHVQERIDQICTLNSSDQFSKTLKKYFPKKHGSVNRKIHKFFQDHPNAFVDLIRKIHRYRKNDNENGWHLDDEGISEVSMIFLIKDREPDIGKYILKMRNAILENQKFIEYCAAQPSILDMDEVQIAHFGKKHRENIIMDLIRNGLMRNIIGCNAMNINAHFTAAFPRILSMLQDLFGIDTDDISSRKYKTIDELAGLLNTFSSTTNKGIDRKKAWMVIQAFHAWGNIVEIEKDYEKNINEGLPHFVNKIKGVLGENNLEIAKDNKSAIYTDPHSGKEIRLLLRVKTPMSICLKMWESEEYTNSDSIRDTFGIFCVYPDNITPDEQIAFMTKFGGLMPRQGYVLKNKNGLSDEDFEKLKNSLKSKPPLHIYTKIGESTDPNLRNMSMSGFMSLGKIKGDPYNVGCEIQFSTEEAAEWKKGDDKNYKSRSAIIAFTRGQKCATLQDIRRIVTAHKKRFDKEEDRSVNEIICDLIGKNKLIIYLSKDKKIMLFSTQQITPTDLKKQNAFGSVWNRNNFFDPNQLDKTIKEKILAQISSMTS